VGDALKVSLPEPSTASSSSDASFGGAASDEVEAEDTVDPHEFAQSYDFGSSSVTVGRIWQLESLWNFAKGSAREPREEIVPVPNDDEVVVFEEFFAVGLRMPPHPALTEILLKYRVQLHQLTPNAIAQLSKYFWAVLSFGREPSSDGFAKHCELHYQSKKVIVDGFEKFQQFDAINFHARRGGEAGLTLAIKNKWSTGWMRAWFYCKVPLHACQQGGKSIYALRLHMSTLKFHTKPSIENSGEDLSNDAFIWASKSIGGWDVVEEFVSCGVWPLAAGVSFKHVKVGLTPISKLKVPLPRFPLSHEDDEDDAGFLVRVEQEARVIVGSYTHTEHKACIASLQNNSHLNRVLELTGVAYGCHPVPVSAEVLMKRKADTTGKVLAKHPKSMRRKGWSLRRSLWCMWRVV
jgi:hypothetical protein